MDAVPSFSLCVVLRLCIVKYVSNQHQMVENKSETWHLIKAKGGNTAGTLFHPPVTLRALRMCISISL
jgi:hypothetical protein